MPWPFSKKPFGAVEVDIVTSSTSGLCYRSLKWSSWRLERYTVHLASDLLRGEAFGSVRRPGFRQSLELKWSKA